MAESTREQALKHIKHCDELFDGKHGYRPDKEYAYNSMRLLALELIGKVEEKTTIRRAAFKEGPLGSWSRFFRSALFPLFMVALVVYIVSRFV